MKDLITLVKKHNIVQLTPYRNAVGDIAIGYGQTIGITSASNWTQEQADQDLFTRLYQSKGIVKHRISSTFNNNQLNALASLVFDVGYEEILRTSIPYFASIDNKRAISDLFMLFNKHGRVVSAKRTAWRRDEQQLFNTKVSR